MTSDAPARPAWPAPEKLLSSLHPWLLERRWFPLKGSAAPLPGTLSIMADVELDAGVHDLLLEAPRGDGGASVLVHVPLVIESAGSLERFTAEGEAAGSAGLVLAGSGAELVDGPHHPAFWRAWSSSALSAGSVTSPEHTQAITQRAHRLRATTGEQSNTSVVLPAPEAEVPASGPEDAAAPDLIVKVFRVLAAGRNPDVEVSVALAQDGWDRVRTPVAWSTLSWDGPQGQVVADSAVATTFIPRADDGFELFSALAGSDDGPGGTCRQQALALATDLGTTTGQMHEHLAAALGTSAPPSPGDLAQSLRERATWAMSEVPALAQEVPGLSERVSQVLTQLRSLPRLEPSTRVHGDYHLGQTLHEVGGQGRWYVLDFEGEPLRPLAQRCEPDQPLRDVAGMLRSFDYAAAVGKVADATWLPAVREAFLEGYRTTVPLEGDEAREVAATELAALELDKALYEAVYEARNRPSWIGIPVRALEAILSDI